MECEYSGVLLKSVDRIGDCWTTMTENHSAEDQYAATVTGIGVNALIDSTCKLMLRELEVG